MTTPLPRGSRTDVPFGGTLAAMLDTIGVRTRCGRVELRPRASHEISISDRVHSLERTDAETGLTCHRVDQCERRF